MWSRKQAWRQGGREADGEEEEGNMTEQHYESTCPEKLAAHVGALSGEATGA